MDHASVTSLPKCGTAQIVLLLQLSVPQLQRNIWTLQQVLALIAVLIVTIVKMTQVPVFPVLLPL